MLLNQTSKRLQEKALESKKVKRNISAIKSIIIIKIINDQISFR